MDQAANSQRVAMVVSKGGDQVTAITATLIAVAIMTIVSGSPADERAILREQHPEVFVGTETVPTFTRKQGFRLSSNIRAKDKLSKMEDVSMCLQVCLESDLCDGLNVFDVVPTATDCLLLDATYHITSTLFEDFRYSYYRKEYQGCMDSTSHSYDPHATLHDAAKCVNVKKGCTDSSAANYDPNANVDDGSCASVIVLGCTNSLALNFNSEANENDGTCQFPAKVGCMDETALNYDEYATEQDSSYVPCEYPSVGCQDPDAVNYNTAVMEHMESTCIYSNDLSFDIYQLYPDTKLQTPILEIGRVVVPKVVDVHECRETCTHDSTCGGFAYSGPDAQPSNQCEFFTHDQVNAGLRTSRPTINLYTKTSFGCGNERYNTYDSDVDVDISLDPAQPMEAVLQKLPKWLRTALKSAQTATTNRRRLMSMFHGGRHVLQRTLLNVTSTYLYVDMNLTYWDANKYCEDIGGSLASINSSVAAGLVQSEVPEFNTTDVWIGAAATWSSYAVTNLDGSPNVYLPLHVRRAQRRVYDSYRCIAHYPDLQKYGIDDCLNERSFVCEFGRTTSSSFKCPRGHGMSDDHSSCQPCISKHSANGYVCHDCEHVPVGWTSTGVVVHEDGSKSCYAITDSPLYPSNGPTEPALSDSYCNAHWPGSYAATLTSQQEAQSAATAIPTGQLIQLGGMWDGSQWTWSNGELVTALPTSGLVVLDDVAILDHLGTLQAPFTADSVDPMRGMCELSNKYVEPVSCPLGQGLFDVFGHKRCLPCMDPANSNGLTCVGECESTDRFMASVWVDENDVVHCFGMYNDTVRVPHTTAEKVCEHEWNRGSLVSVKTGLLQQAVQSMFVIPSMGLHMGLRLPEGVDAWADAMWNDGSPLGVGFSNWRPEAEQHTGDCAAMTFPHYEWNRIECSHRAHFICEYTSGDIDPTEGFDPIDPMGSLTAANWTGFSDIDNILDWLQISAQPIRKGSSILMPMDGGTYVDLSGLPAHINPYKTCYNPAYGCTRKGALNFDPHATEDDGSCYYYDLPGCNDKRATNYNTNATSNDGSCTFPATYGCTNAKAINYDSDAVIDDGTCMHDRYGCMDADAVNFDALATKSSYSCIYAETGSVSDFVEYVGEQLSSPLNGVLKMKNMPNGEVECKYLCTEMLNSAAMRVPVGVGECVGFNYNPNAQSPFCQFFDHATFSFGRLIAEEDFTYFAREVIGCQRTDAVNYNQYATVHNETACIDWKYGCLRPDADNYDINVNMDDGSCIDNATFGCMDPEATNYDSTTDLDDGSCIYPPKNGCTNVLALNHDQRATQDDGTCILSVLDCMDTTALNFNSAANVHVQSECVYIGTTTTVEFTTTNSTRIYSPRRNYAQLKRVASKDECIEWCSSKRSCVAFNYRMDQAGDDFCQFFNAWAMELAEFIAHEDTTIFTKSYIGCGDTTAVNFDEKVDENVPSACLYS